MKQKDITIIINYESNLTLSFELEAYIKTILTITEFKKGLFEFTFINDTKMIELNQNYFNKKIPYKISACFYLKGPKLCYHSQQDILFLFV